MAWFFGGGGNNAAGNNNQAGAAAQGGAAGGPPEPPQNLTKAEKKAMEAYRFDSSALERAAEAARTLETSRKDEKFDSGNYFIIRL